ncbi:hypothetical protein ACQ86N_38970 [Puia sp. P3]|uniref:hypothetical protein n=1 Tax=Puia sp. P3 TaxID=3423952 RepID=UPI003D66E64F
MSIVVGGFRGDEVAVRRGIADSVGGFCLVLAGLKAWLEFGVELNLVRDRFPEGK